MPLIIFCTSHTKWTPGPALRINCRACGRENVQAESFETEERITLHFLLLPTQRERHVVCRACGEDRLSDLPLDELAALGPEQSEWHLFRRVSLVAKTLAVASLVLFGCPFLSLPLGVAAMVMARGSGAWPFRVGLLGIVLTVLLWGVLFARSALVDLGVL